MREYPTLKRLRAGEVIDLGGIKFRMAVGDLKSGDLYVAERNSGPRLLTLKKIEGDFIGALAIPTTPEYPYCVWECVKVEEVT
jgi:hypothetical protein